LTPAWQAPHTVSAELVQLETINDPALQMEHVCGALSPPTQNEPLGQVTALLVPPTLKYVPGDAPVMHTLLPGDEANPLPHGKHVPLPGPYVLMGHWEQ